MHYPVDHKLCELMADKICKQSTAITSAILEIWYCVREIALTFTDKTFLLLSKSFPCAMTHNAQVFLYEQWLYILIEIKLYEKNNNNNKRKQEL